MEKGKDAPIVCGISKWYYKRMGMMILMFLGFGGWFFWDGYWNWPKKNQIIEEYDRFEEIAKERETFLALEPDESAWPAEAERRGYPPDKDWKTYAAKKGWPEERPEKFHDASAIRTQKILGWTLGVVSPLVILGMILANRGKKTSADGASFSVPGLKEKVPFSEVVKVDKRKWDRKGLAYIFSKSGESTSKAVIDCLKYQGAEGVFDRLMEQLPDGCEIVDLESELES